MTTHRSLRSFGVAFLLAALATGLSECGSSSESESCIEGFQCPPDRADLGETCKPKCGAEHTRCAYRDPCLESCDFPYECVDGKWKLGPICAVKRSCPTTAPTEGVGCDCSTTTAPECTYGDCAAGDATVVSAVCSSASTWAVTTKPCP